MSTTRKTTLIICASLLCAGAGAAEGAAAAGQGAAAAAKGATGGRAQAPAHYSATVKGDEARITLPAPQRPSWSWRRRETRDRSREYMFAVNVRNEGREYSFGLYLWKFPNSLPGRGGLSALLEAGQESLFERAPNGHRVIVRDGGVRVRHDGERIIITVKGRRNVARLFSGRPAEVTVETEVLDQQPTTQAVPVTYEN